MKQPNLKILEFSQIENHGANHKDTITFIFDYNLQIKFGMYYQTEISDKWHSDGFGGLELNHEQAVQLRDLLNRYYPIENYPSEVQDAI